SHSFKLASRRHSEEIVSRQVVQARVADNASYVFALAASMSKMDSQVRSGVRGLAYERDWTAFAHVFDLLELRIRSNIRELRRNADDSMAEAASAARRHNDALPNGDFVIHESSPVARGTGRPVAVDHVRQFDGDRYISAGG